MHSARICAVITSPDPDAAHSVEGNADLFEIRIDLVGRDWEKIEKEVGRKMPHR